MPTWPFLKSSCSAHFLFVCYNSKFLVKLLWYYTLCSYICYCTFGYHIHIYIYKYIYIYTHTHTHTHISLWCFWEVASKKSHFFQFLKCSLQRYYMHCVKSVQIRSIFWSMFSRIRTEYGEILRISPYSVRMRKDTDQKKIRIWILFTQWCLQPVIISRLSSTFYVSTIKSCLKEIWTKKYILVCHICLLKSEPKYFLMVTSLTAQFLKINLPYSNDLHRCTT